MAFEPHATSFSKANAQILAQASAMAYRDPATCAKWATVSGFMGPFDAFDNADTQGFVTESADAIIVAFRGTQPNRPMDWFVDFRAGNNDFAAAVNAKLGSGIFRFVNDRDIVPRVPLFTMGFCHYGGQQAFDHAGKASSAESAVETLNDALTFAKGVVNFQVFGQVAGLVTDSLKNLVRGNFTEEHEKAFRNQAIEILKGGVEKIEDHSMDDHYLARLETKLPSL